VASIPSSVEVKMLKKLCGSFPMFSKHTIIRQGKNVIKNCYVRGYSSSNLIASDIDVGVIGGGIIGLAVARELLIRNPKLKVTIFEKENQLAFHQSKNNSGVIHGGIYYPPGSMRAKLCVEGNAKMYQYCNEKHIPHFKCGKVIVAVKEGELSGLQKLYDRGIQNGVPNLRFIEKDEIQKIEPHLTKAIRGIFSPETGIVDYRVVSKSYAKDIEDAGGSIRLCFQADQFNRVTKNEKDIRSPIELVSTTGESAIMKNVIVCGGLYSDRLARKTGGKEYPAVIPFRGEWFKLKPQYSSLVNTLIYPVPDPAFSWLGIHFTKKMNGEVWTGPNAVLATAREGYKITDFNFKDIMEALRTRGLQKLISKYFRTGVGEVYRATIRSAYVKDLQDYVPEIKREYLQSEKATGVRALALGPDGLIDDFVFDANENWKSVLHVRNAPSPGATSSLAIARVVADMAEASFFNKTAPLL